MAYAFGMGYLLWPRFGKWCVDHSQASWYTDVHSNKTAHCPIMSNPKAQSFAGNELTPLFEEPRHEHIIFISSSHIIRYAADMHHIEPRHPTGSIDPSLCRAAGRNGCWTVARAQSLGFWIQESRAANSLTLLMTLNAYRDTQE